MKKQGLVIVHTGNGKGKTTAALGLAIRAWGDGFRVLILQFIKGGCTYGELKTIETLKNIDDRIEIDQGGLGFTNKGPTTQEEHKAAAQETLKRAKEEIQSGKWDLIILDEINCPEDLHLVMTGRDAAESLVERADLVTEMKEIKHPYQKGIKAQKGIEF